MSNETDKPLAGARPIYIDGLIADNDRLRRELEKAKAELARMRPVVEAAAEYRDEFCADCGDGGCEATDCKMARAVDAYRAGAGKGGE